VVPPKPARGDADQKGSNRRGPALHLVRHDTRDIELLIDVEISGQT